jgi:hypothetical protein
MEFVEGLCLDADGTQQRHMRHLLSIAGLDAGAN